MQNERKQMSDLNRPTSPLALESVRWSIVSDNSFTENLYD